MKFYGDFHVHTVASTHAYSTIEENAKAASDRGLIAIALTDHAKSMINAPLDFYFKALKVVPDNLFGVRILKGIEANISDYDGSLDVGDDLLSSLDIRIASMHTLTLKGEPSVSKCTEAYLGAVRNRNIDILGHSGQVYFRYDYETVIKECAIFKKLIEINNASFYNRPDSIENIKKILKLCRKHSVSVIVDSDSHTADRVGDMSYASALLDEMRFPKELVINSTKDQIKDYLKSRNISI